MVRNTLPWHKSIDGVKYSPPFTFLLNKHRLFDEVTFKWNANVGLVLWELGIQDHCRYCILSTLDSCARPLKI